METRTETPSAVKAPHIPESAGGQLAERQQSRVVAPSAVDAKTGGLMSALIDAVRDPSIAIERMRELHQLYRDISAVEQEKLFLDALSRCQATLEPVRRTLKNDHTHSMYASLAAIQREVMPKMAAEGLSLTFNEDPSLLDKGFVRVIGTLAHREGHKQTYARNAPLDNAGAKGNVNKTDIQAYQSSVSYATRGLYKAIFALAEEGDDKDGNGPRTPPAKLSEAQQKEIAAECDALNVRGKLLEEYRVASMADIPAGEYETIKTLLANTRKRRQQQAAGAKS